MLVSESLDMGASSYGNEILTLEETCALLRVSRPTLFELIKRGDIPCRKVGRAWRFRREVVLDWLQGNVRVSRSRRYG